MIDQAQQSVHLQFYIFDSDETGRTVATALIKAAQRNISVFLHLDAYGSQRMSGKLVSELQMAGVQIHWFEPLFKSRRFYFGRRLHHKVVVTDAYYSLVGGLNISDKYNDMPEKKAWLDAAIFCEGELSAEIYAMCRKLWGDRKRTILKNPSASHSFHENVRTAARLRLNDWVKRKMQVWKTYHDMFSSAQQSVLIMCSYFLPGRTFRKKLSQLAKKNVRIVVILAGRSDVMIAKHAERFLYSWMLKNGIEIYEYRETVLHAKVAVCDSRLVTIGSYNINNISAYASLEANVDVMDTVFAAQVEKELEGIIKNHCIKISFENDTLHHGFFLRVWQRFCYRLINGALNLFTFYFKQE